MQAAPIAPEPCVTAVFLCCCLVNKLREIRLHKTYLTVPGPVFHKMPSRCCLKKSGQV